MTEHQQFPTQEIGSLPKFSWRVKPFRSIALQDSDIESARDWGKRLKVKEAEALLKLLRKRSRFTGREKKRIVDFSMLYALGIQETAGSGAPNGRGIDIVWSGEQARTEMYETPVSNIGWLRVHRQGQGVRQQVLAGGIDKKAASVSEKLPS